MHIFLYTTLIYIQDKWACEARVVGGDRTPDLLLAKQMCYPLHHSGVDKMRFAHRLLMLTICTSTPCLCPHPKTSWLYAFCRWAEWCEFIVVSYGQVNSITLLMDYISHDIFIYTTLIYLLDKWACEARVVGGDRTPDPLLAKQIYWPLHHSGVDSWMV